MATGGMMWTGGMRARPGVTGLGGICWGPIAGRRIPPTTTSLANEVTMVRTKGARAMMTSSVSQKTKPLEPAVGAAGSGWAWARRVMKAGLILFTTRTGWINPIREDESKWLIEIPEECHPERSEGP